jgi:hypothetical protein
MTTRSYKQVRHIMFRENCELSLTFCPELSTAVEARQQLESQQQENTTVKKVRS